MELSQKLKELRKKQGLTQLELAERLFVSSLDGKQERRGHRQRTCRA